MQISSMNEEPGKVLEEITDFIDINCIGSSSGVVVGAEARLAG